MNRLGAIACYAFLATAIIASDLWSKRAVFELLGADAVRLADDPNYFPRPREVSLVDGWLSFEATMNRGAFSGWFSRYPALLMLVALFAVLVTVLLAAVPRRSAPSIVIPLGLICGGALGNLYDRFHFGAVRDFIKCYRGDWVWPNFNIADSAICVGVGLLLVREFAVAHRARRARRAAPTPATEEAARTRTP